MLSIVAGVKEYIQAMVDRVLGMKVLLLDKETMGIISMVFSQSEIMQHEVFLFQCIDAAHEERMRHMKAICLVRPVDANYRLLTTELKTPKYKEYHVFFTNMVPHNRLDQLACCDEHEVVQQVQEFFADIYALSHDLFSLNLPSTSRLTENHTMWTPHDQWNFARTVEGLLAACLTLRMLPAIRYTAASDLTRQVAHALQTRITEEQSLFDTINSERRGEPTPVLLLMDRRNDPVTPLLNQWTYQAMLHELLSMENNRIDMSEVPGIRPELKEIVMSTTQDQFFEENMMANFGDLCVSIQNLVDDYQRQTKSNAQIASIEDMQRFVDEYPEFRKMSGNVSKHVDVVHELHRVVETKGLLQASELEQEIACSENQREHLRRVDEMIRGTSITKMQKLRLVLLYALRYERNVSVEQLKDQLRSQGIGEEQVGLVDHLLRYAGSHARSGDLFQNKTMKAHVARFVTNTLKNVDNVYTQHKTYLAGVVDELMKGKLNDTSYPFLEGCRCAVPTCGQMPRTLVFVVGGATFEEARDVAELNRSLGGPGGQTIVLGGTTVHNSRSFLADVARLHSGGPE